jgi:hypothetical protein
MIGRCKVNQIVRVAASVAALSVALAAQDVRLKPDAASDGKATWEERPALLLANDKIELTVLPEGGAMAQILLKEDKERLNPLWNPYWIARQAGLNAPANLYRGHFVCVDGFGPVSPQERAAGLPMHGEAHTLLWEMKAYGKAQGTTSASFSVSLPQVQEVFSRAFHVVDGENIVWVESTLTNALAFDRPVFWGEHATISAPFLEPGKVAVDMPVAKAKTKAYQPAPTRQLQSYADFTWPMAPTLDGKLFDVRTAPMRPNTTDHTTALLDASRRLVFVTALHLDKKLMIGWVFRREEYPWVQTWLSYPGPSRMTRGLEFATQPFDLTRAEVLSSGPLFDSPVFRIVPAKSSIQSSFLMFYTSVPDGFRKVDDVRLEGGKLIVEDKAAGRTIALRASRTL